jgi:hypothetical protein
MTDEQADKGVTVGEEIRCLLAAGWVWDEDSLVHPTSKNIWIRYQRAETGGITARSEQFEAELKQAVQEARQREQGMGSGGQ